MPNKTKRKMKSIVYVAWLESERGWGVRPDGCSLHLNPEDFKAYMKQYWSEMPKQVPDEYSRPCSDPTEALVKNSLYQKIKKSENGLRFWEYEIDKMLKRKDITLKL